MNVPMAIRPLSSGAPQVRTRGKSSKGKRILRHDQQLLLLENTAGGEKRDREQEILDGIEKF